MSYHYVYRVFDNDPQKGGKLIGRALSRHDVRKVATNAGVEDYWVKKYRAKNGTGKET